MSKGFDIHGSWSSAQAKISGAYNNISGTQFANNTINGNVVTGESKADKCHSALCQGITNPFYDRKAIDRFLRRQNKVKPNSSVFDWILNAPHFKTWKSTNTHSQLLWIHGGTGMGKTPLTLFLINEFENKPEQIEEFVVLYYFCDSKNHTRNHATSVLRGLMLLLLKARPALLEVLLSDWEIQKNSLFDQNSLEALWKNFKTMARDPRAGRIFCVIDGIDQCEQDSLEDLLDMIKEFYEQEADEYKLRQAQNSNPAIQQQQGPGLQMLLISREAPKCISETLEKFPRISLDPAAKKETKRPLKNTAKLASLAREALRQETARATALATDPTPSMSNHITSPNQQTYGVNPVPSSVTLKSPDPVELSSDSLPKNLVPEQASYMFDEVKEEVEIIVDEYQEEDEEEEEEEVVENQSLAVYIKERVADLATERAYPEELCSFLINGLENRGNGTFLWVDLAIEEIKRYQQKDIEQVLAQLPEDPNEIYFRTLQAIPHNLVSLVMAILRWVLAARRPLHVPELGAALILLGFQAFDARSLVLQGIAACGSILTVEEDDAIHITHNSVKDLLTDESSPLRTNAHLFQFYVNLGDTDGDIASICISYLEQGCLQSGAVLPTDGQEKYFKHVTLYPLFPYAVEFWPAHLRAATRPQVNLSSPFFVKDSKIRKSWWLTYWPATTGKWALLAPRSFTTLHLASYLNLPYLGEQLRLTGELRRNLDDRDNHGSSPISYATEFGHVDMFLLLLKQGAKLDAVGENCFELAARKGQVEIVETLLKAGYPVDTLSRNIGALEGLTQATKYLPGVLNEGIKTDKDEWKLMTRDTGSCGTALHQAALPGHVSVVELLLKWGGNVRATTTKNWTPLHASSWTGQIDCVKLLIEKGADAGAMTDFGWVPFHCAASRGKTSVVELYIKLGMSVDTMTVKQKSALHLASWGGSAPTVRALLTNGAAVNAQSYKGETPLHLAVRNFKPEIVELLLSFGANKLIINKEGLPVSNILRNIQGGGTEIQKDMLRILDTFGMPGYIPWRPKKDLHAPASPAENTSQVTSLAISIQQDKQRRSSTSSPFILAQPNAPMAPSFAAHLQSDFKTNQFLSSQQPMFAAPNLGPQTPVPAQPGPAVQLSLSSYQLASTADFQRPDPITTPLISTQDAAVAFTPPPPYTSSSNAQTPALEKLATEIQPQPSVVSVQSEQLSTFQQPAQTSMSQLVNFNPNSFNSTTVAANVAPVPLRPVSVPQQATTPLSNGFGRSRSQASVPTITLPESPLQSHTSIQNQNQQCQQMQPQSAQTPPVQSIPLQTHTTPPSASPPQPIQSFPEYQPQQIYGHTAPPSPLLQQPMPSGSTQNLQQQFSQMTFSNPVSSFTPQPQQLPQQPQWSSAQSPSPNIYQQPLTQNSSPQNPSPNIYQQSFTQNSSPQNPSPNIYQQPFAQNSSPQYFTPTQQYTGLQTPNPMQQYPTSPSPIPYQQQYPPQQTGGYLSVGVGIPTGVFGAQNGNMGSAMQFAPPPTGAGMGGQMGFEKKRSFRNLGGFLK